MIHAVFFDLDDTLLDRTRTVKGFIQDQYRRYQLNHQPYDSYLQRFLALDARGYGDKLLMYQTLVEEFAIGHSPEALLDDFLQKAWRNCHNLPGVEQVLTELRAHGHKLGVITNGSSEQRTKLTNCGLNPLLDVSLVSDEEGMKKPDPEIFHRAAQRLKVEVGTCLFVGDNPSTDILGAQRAGMKTVWFKGNFDWPDGLTIRPDYHISALADLLTIAF